ncbi:M4 family metallopeptidase [uncultured Fibrella sp.]|uniref:M4 family metallopeptidase n=1 Tax=uncultured Fibrella sp. TaxID=1284596 RepID=UPI0035CBBF8B
MKLLYACLLASTSALAQPPVQANNAQLPGSTSGPGRGFLVKQKTGRPDAELARRLDAIEAPLPTDQRTRQTLLATGSAPVSLPPLKLKIVRDASSGLPIYIENLSAGRPVRNQQARRSVQATTYQFLSQVRGLLTINDPEQAFAIKQTTTDELGQTHQRMMQTYQGVPVYGAELTVHQTNGEVTLITGQYRVIPATLDIRPALSLVQAGKAAMRSLGKAAPVQMFGQGLIRLEPVTGELCVYAGSTDTKETPRLAYDLTVRPNLMERWQYVIDAQTGDVLRKFNSTCSIDGPRDASARDLNGVSRSFKTYQIGSNYVMMDASRVMYSTTKSKLPDSPVGALWVIDAANTYGDNISVKQVSSANNTNWTATAASAQYNGGIAYEYFQKTFKRNSINGNGGTVTSIINVNDPETGKGMDNAYWNGEYMMYGNGDVAFKPLAGSLDVAGHEMSHGVIQNSANLVYDGQSGALNESFADVFGVLIDRDDWTIGEEVVVAKYFPSGALRSMANPNQGGKSDNGYQPKTMAQYVSTTDDNGGVHINSGIPNYAFYQIASATSKDKAEQIYYRALTTYLTRSSKFLDMRLAAIKAATDLYGGSGAEVAAVKTAFDNVGITENSTPTDQKTPIPTSTGQDFMALVSTSDSKLYNTPYPTTAFTQRSLSGLKRRPSLTDDGSVAVFVGSDGKIRASSMTKPASETVISQEAGWANVVISKDGTKLAALTDKQDGKLWVYSFDLAKWKTYTLYNPTSAQGVKTGEVVYADSFEWDYSGEYVIYDAYNKLTNAGGQSVDYWDVGIINVWDGSKKNFPDVGRIDKLFTDLDEGISIGNPSFSKTSPDLIAFDYFDENAKSYYVLSANIEKGDVEIVYENNDLGFPSYSRTDNAVVFGTTNSSGKESIALMNLNADKLTPKGAVVALYTGAKWPVWYSNVARAIPTKANQTITFNAIADQVVTTGSITLQATSSAGLAVGFTVPSGPAELVGNQLRFTGTGTVTVRAFQEGNSQTYAATPVDRTFAVKAAPVVILGIEPDWANEVRLFPNPSRSRVTVELPAGITWQAVDLVSTSGAVMQQQRNTGTSIGTLSVELGTLPSGLYVISIETNQGRVQRKVLRE